MLLISIDALHGGRYITNQSVINKAYVSSSSPLPSVPSKRERRKEARPGELLDAALDLFVEKGFAATRVDDVAARAGVSKGTLFLYFPSKEELFKAMVRQSIAGRFDEWNQELGQFEGATSDLLRHCYQAWWDRIGNTKASGITKLIFSESQNFPEITLFYREEVILPGQALIRRIIQRGIDRGEFRPVPLDCLVHVLFAPMVFLMMWKHSIGACVPDASGFTPEQYINAQVDTILLGLCVRPEASTPPLPPSSSPSSTPSV
jgi:AcrR family transcriptional regulator